jgi:hypothetical protein
MDTLPGKFVWFEHVSPDLVRTRAFYEPLFLWHVETMPTGQGTYPMILNRGRGIGGLRRATAGEPPHWEAYLSVNDVDGSFRIATAAGARTVVAPCDIGNVGRGAAVRDPTGALVWLCRGAEGDRPDEPVVAPGDWSWTELCTHDAKRALAFYEAALGYGHETRDMGEAGRYTVLKSADGVPRAGLYQMPADGTPSAWLAYVEVADCDATVSHARKLGARSVPVPATDIPAVGRFAVLQDPHGATLAVIQSTPRPG